MRCDIRRSSLLSSLTLSALLLGSRPARAFDSASQFYASPNVPDLASVSASAEGIYFTGAPRFAGLTCGSCHTDGPQKVALAIEADDPALFTSGYVPGRTYQLELVLSNEQEGRAYATPTCTEPVVAGDSYAYQPCNNNGFALEIDRDTTPLAGAAVFCASPPVDGVCPPADAAADEAEVAPGGDAVFAHRTHSTAPGAGKVVTRNGALTWHLWWTAPAAGSGSLTLFAAAVDGNGGDGTTNDDQDPVGDDTVQLAVPLSEAGTQAAFDAQAGCSLAPGGAAGRDRRPLVVGVALLLSLFRRRRRESRGRAAG